MSESVSISPTAVPSTIATIATEGTASSLVHSNLKSYARSIIADQFPSVIDGLKKIHLHFLYAVSRTDQLTNNPVKSGRMVSETTVYHPHGDASTYEVLVSLAQPWTTNPPLVRFHGNKGTYSGAKPGAVRYTEMSLSQFAKDVYYAGIDLKALPVTRGKSGYFEPENFIPAIPTALLYPSFTVGVAYQSKSTGLYFKDLCDLTIAYCKHMAETPHAPFHMKDYVRYLMPEFPSVGIVTNKSELVQAYRNKDYNARIRIDSDIELSSDALIIRSLPPLSSVANFVAKLRESLDTKGSNFDKKLVDIFNSSKHADVADIRLILKRNVDVFSVLNDVQAIAPIYDTYVPNPNYTTPDGTIVPLSYFDLLLLWYKARSQIVMTSKRKSLRTMKTNEMTLEAQLKVIDHTDDVLKIIRENDPMEGAILLQKTYELTPSQAASIYGLNLKALARTSGDELKFQLDKVRADIDTLVGSFNQIPNEIAETVSNLRRKYGNYNRRTEIADYIGYLTVGGSSGGGIIQFSTIDEIYEIAERFPKVSLDITMYEGHNRFAIDDAGKTLSKWYNHKYDTNIRIISMRNHPLSGGIFSINIRDDGTACAVSGVECGPVGVDYVYTKKNVCGITCRGGKGTLQTFDVRETFSVRRSIEARGKNTDIQFAYPEMPGEFYYIGVMNTKEPNVIRVHRIQKDTTQIPVGTMGDLKFFVHPSGKDWFFVPPEKFLNRCAARIMHFRDVSRFFNDDESSVRIDLNSQGTKRMSAGFAQIV